MKTKTMTTIELAKRWKMSPATLRNWRTWGQGPKYVRLKNWFVTYQLAEVRRWERNFRKLRERGTGAGIAARLARQELLRVLRRAR